MENHLTEDHLQAADEAAPGMMHGLELPVPVHA
jgi:hypothetical protein